MAEIHVAIKAASLSSMTVAEMERGGNTNIDR